MWVCNIVAKRYIHVYLHTLFSIPFNTPYGLQMMNKKKLAVFDFDHTIVNDNTDTVVRGLLPKAVTPNYVHSGWTAYMQSVFDALYSQNIDERTIRNVIRQIKPVTGMCELIKELSENLNFDVIIISDSNSYFISNWLDEYKLKLNITEIFTNPAEFTDGLLKIRMYQFQDSCKLSEKNLCKGQIFEDFVKSKKDAGTIYGQTVYVGDGLNDFCPIIRLNETDLACCREGFKCAEIVKNVKGGKPFRNKMYEIKSETIVWKTGFDILDKIKCNFV